MIHITENISDYKIIDDRKGDLLKVLYTGFKGKNNSSYQLISKISGQKIFLTNSFDGLKKDIMNIVDQYHLIIMLGLDTNLKDAVRIERVAEWEGMEEVTSIDCDIICKYMAENGVKCAVSDIPTKYLCNAAYYHMLQKVGGKAVFIHIPSLKNMSEHTRLKLMECMEDIC